VSTFVHIFNSSQASPQNSQSSSNHSRVSSVSDSDSRLTTVTPVSSRIEISSASSNSFSGRLGLVAAIHQQRLQELQNDEARRQQQLSILRSDLPSYARRDIPAVIRTRVEQRAPLNYWLLAAMVGVLPVIQTILEKDSSILEFVCSIRLLPGRTAYTLTIATNFSYLIFKH